MYSGYNTGSYIHVIGAEWTIQISKSEGAVSIAWIGILMCAFIVDYL